MSYMLQKQATKYTKISQLLRKGLDDFLENQAKYAAGRRTLKINEARPALDKAQRIYNRALDSFSKGKTTDRKFLDKATKTLYSESKKFKKLEDKLNKQIAGLSDLPNLFKARVADKLEDAASLGKKVLPWVGGTILTGGAGYAAGEIADGIKSSKKDEPKSEKSKANDKGSEKEDKHSRLGYGVGGALAAAAAAYAASDRKNRLRNMLIAGALAGAGGAGLAHWLNKDQA